jgi:mRNA interferase YafQ
MYRIVTTKSYRKAFKRLIRSPRFDASRLEMVIDILASGEQLPREFLDHKLSGELRGFMECHVQNDLLLVYHVKDDRLILVLVDLGTHASLFR